MIIDVLSQAQLYDAIHPRFAAGFQALRDGIAHRPPGRYELDGQNLFALVIEYTLSPDEIGLWEAHRKYIDIQFIAQGRERMGVIPVTQLKTRTPYDAEKDLEFFEGPPTLGTSLLMESNMFAIFFPHDAHLPKLSAGPAMPIKKVVIKVAVNPNQ